MCECEFEYPSRWPDFYRELLSDDPREVRSAVAALVERDRALEDHLAQRCCDGTPECLFTYPTGWDQFYADLLSGDTRRVQRAVVALELRDRDIEAHLTGRPCFGTDEAIQQVCHFDYPHLWHEFYEALLSGDDRQVFAAVGVLEARDRALEDHLRFRLCRPPWVGYTGSTSALFRAGFWDDPTLVSMGDVVEWSMPLPFNTADDVVVVAVVVGASGGPPVLSVDVDGTPVPIVIPQGSLGSTESIAALILPGGLTTLHATRTVGVDRVLTGWAFAVGAHRSIASTGDDLHTNAFQTYAFTDAIVFQAGGFLTGVGTGTGTEVTPLIVGTDVDPVTGLPGVGLGQIATWVGSLETVGKGVVWAELT